ncbi:hypothetical protein Bca52824_035132 [Brassica carinata]|uniref:Uncharacterized protein n=1 Tax=Brassica carinata TaxID=52824 RepID=A0A8X7S4M4_BRACI|nr:hypothetical protein Bca52824_035132 [Brassica carinata]
MHPEFARRAYRYGIKKLFWEQKDEYGVYRDGSGFARGSDGDIINASKEDIKNCYKESYGWLLHMSSEHASSFTRRDLVHEIYTKDEVNEMITGMMGQRSGRRQPCIRRLMKLSVHSRTRSTGWSRGMS